MTGGFWPSLPASPDSPLVVLVQDAHGIPAAQRSLSAITSAVAAGRSGREPLLVAVEGAWGPVETGWLNAYPDKKIRDAAAETLLASGLITGEEHLAVTDDERRVSLFGAEDESLFKADRRAREASRADRDKALADLEGLEDRLKGLKAAFYPAPLREWDRLAAHAAEGGMAPRLAGARRLWGRSFPAKRFPQTEAFLETIRLEEGLNTAALEEEAPRLLADLSERLAPEELSRLAAASVEVRQGRLGAAAFYGRLRALAAGAGRKSPLLDRYADLLEKQSRLDPAALFSEASRLETELPAFLAGVDHRAQTLVRAARDVDLLRRFYALELTPDDWAEFQQHAPSSERIKSLISPLLGKEGRGEVSSLSQSQKSISPLSSAHQACARFYELAEARNAVLARNALREAHRRGADRLVLVAGGFHTPGVTRLLRKAGVSHVVVTPRFDAADGATRKTLRVESLFSESPAALAALAELPVHAGSPENRALARQLSGVRWAPDPFSRNGRLLLPGTAPAADGRHAVPLLKELDAQGRPAARAAGDEPVQRLWPAFFSDPSVRAFLQGSRAGGRRAVHFLNHNKWLPAVLSAGLLAWAVLSSPVLGNGRSLPGWLAWALVGGLPWMTLLSRRAGGLLSILPSLEYITRKNDPASPAPRPTDPIDRELKEIEDELLADLELVEKFLGEDPLKVAELNALFEKMESADEGRAAWVFDFLAPAAQRRLARALPGRTVGRMDFRKYLIRRHVADLRAYRGSLLYERWLMALEDPGSASNAEFLRTLPFEPEETHPDILALITAADRNPAGRENYLSILRHERRQAVQSQVNFLQEFARELRAIAGSKHLPGKDDQEKEVHRNLAKARLDWVEKRLRDRESFLKTDLAASFDVVAGVDRDIFWVRRRVRIFRRPSTAGTMQSSIDDPLAHMVGSLAASRAEIELYTAPQIAEITDRLASELIDDHDRFHAIEATQQAVKAVNLSRRRTPALESIPFTSGRGLQTVAVTADLSAAAEAEERTGEVLPLMTRFSGFENALKGVLSAATEGKKRQIVSMCVDSEIMIGDLCRTAAHALREHPILAGEKALYVDLPETFRRAASPDEAASAVLNLLDLAQTGRTSLFMNVTIFENEKINYLDTILTSWARQREDSRAILYLVSTIRARDRVLVRNRRGEGGSLQYEKLLKSEGREHLLTDGEGEKALMSAFAASMAATHRMPPPDPLIIEALYQAVQRASNYGRVREGLKILEDVIVRVDLEAERDPSSRERRILWKDIDPSLPLSLRVSVDPTAPTSPIKPLTEEERQVQADLKRLLFDNADATIRGQIGLTRKLLKVVHTFLDQPSKKRMVLSALESFWSRLFIVYPGRAGAILEKMTVNPDNKVQNLSGIRLLRREVSASILGQVQDDDRVTARAMRRDALQATAGPRRALVDFVRNNLADPEHHHTQLINVKRAIGEFIGATEELERSNPSWLGAGLGPDHQQILGLANISPNQIQTFIDAVKHMESQAVSFVRGKFSGEADVEILLDQFLHAMDLDPRTRGKGDDAWSSYESNVEMGRLVDEGLLRRPQDDFPPGDLLLKERLARDPALDVFEAFLGKKLFTALAFVGEEESEFSGLENRAVQRMVQDPAILIGRKIRRPWALDFRSGLSRDPQMLERQMSHILSHAQRSGGVLFVRLDPLYDHVPLGSPHEQFVVFRRLMGRLMNLWSGDVDRLPIVFQVSRRLHRELEGSVPAYRDFVTAVDVRTGNLEGPSSSTPPPADPGSDPDVTPVPPPPPLPSQTQYPALGRPPFVAALVLSGLGLTLAAFTGLKGLVPAALGVSVLFFMAPLSHALTAGGRAGATRRDQEALLQRIGARLWFIPELRERFPLGLTLLPWEEGRTGFWSLFFAAPPDLVRLGDTVDGNRSLRLAPSVLAALDPESRGLGSAISRATALNLLLHELKAHDREWRGIAAEFGLGAFLRPLTRQLSWGERALTSTARYVIAFSKLPQMAFHAFGWMEDIHRSPAERDPVSPRPWALLSRLIAAESKETDVLVFRQEKLAEEGFGENLQKGLLACVADDPQSAEASLSSLLGPDRAARVLLIPRESVAVEGGISIPAVEAALSEARRVRARAVILEDEEGISFWIGEALRILLTAEEKPVVLEGASAERFISQVAAVDPARAAGLQAELAEKGALRLPAQDHLRLRDIEGARIYAVQA